MLGLLSTTQYFKYEVSNWEYKKKQMTDALSDSVYTRPTLTNGMTDFETDRGSPRTYVDKFMAIFEEELQQFGKDLKVEQFKISDIWSVQYKKGDHHPVHTHGRTNLSGILYLDYDSNEHTPTNFVTNTINTSTNMTDIVTPIIKEGDIFIFPSNVLHFTVPNKSDKIRKIVSFDICING